LIGIRYLKSKPNWFLFIEESTPRYNLLIPKKLGRMSTGKFLILNIPVVFDGMVHKTDYTDI